MYSVKLSFFTIPKIGSQLLYSECIGLWGVGMYEILLLLPNEWDLNSKRVILYLVELSAFYLNAALKLVNKVHCPAIKI